MSGLGRERTLAPVWNGWKAEIASVPRIQETHRSSERLQFRSVRKWVDRWQMQARSRDRVLDSQHYAVGPPQAIRVNVPLGRLLQLPAAPGRGRGGDRPGEVEVDA